MINNTEYKQSTIQFPKITDKSMIILINEFEAFICEIMRIVSVATHGIPHYTPRDI